MMEHLPARDEDAITASLGIVEESDVYVGVFAFRYGYVPKGHEVSITEMENNRAAELKKPRFFSRTIVTQSKRKILRPARAN
jgi:hypothetical protein